MGFTLFTNDTDPHHGLPFDDRAKFWFEPGGVLVIQSHLGVRYYSPHQWQEVHYRDHDGGSRPALPGE
ncbi:hypothetical protein IU501_35465 [Nocardia otitidiscaviarum]|uniref:hypothetical protein n=1 Tax=Nocardia otitidiscaviarum TaxID=1823 RepID=UPI0018940B4A|nr:hypothetical protein [Nocardia otitidiscaviarum]MBF6138274.1 hypothetical protein [Nocardia otitidiscaviarum]